jgi:ABC-type amino acid transport system permease subunit
MFSITLLSELMFTALLLGCLLVLRAAGDRRGWYLAAGILAGLAYLTRSIGLVLVVSVPLGLLLDRKGRHSPWFLAGCLPFVGTWTLWARTHGLATSDPSLIYYTDYFRYQFLMVGLADLPVVLWKNFDSFLYGVGSLFVPRVIDGPLVKVLTETLAVAVLFGCWRLVTQQRQLLQYGLFALMVSPMFLLWHYPPNERFVIPLFPLLAVGFREEAAHLLANVRAGLSHHETSQRIAARGLAMMAAFAITAIVGAQAFTLFWLTPASLAQHRSNRSDRLAAYKWLANQPRDSAVLAYADPLVYLYSGRSAQRITMPTSLWYRENYSGMVSLYRRVEDFAAHHRLEYVLATSDDMRQEMAEREATAVAQLITTNPNLQPVFEHGSARLFRVRDEDEISRRLQPSARRE